LFGIAFIICGMTFSALGRVPPALAAAMHTAGSLLVVFNSARLVRKGEEMEHYHSEAPVSTATPPRARTNPAEPKPELAAA
ncbi:MAG TPA: hypothetical protein VHH88_00645, partial [Verrucomicrobiae bacterium]|nr:hypothetical protein [Verrucomicrobiae bacterium]